jgi:hypothetical protein
MQYNVSYAAHGFVGTESDKPTSGPKSLAYTLGGYQARKTVTEPDMVYAKMRPTEYKEAMLLRESRKEKRIKVSDIKTSSVSALPMAITYHNTYIQPEKIVEWVGYHLQDENEGGEPIAVLMDLIEQIQKASFQDVDRVIIYHDDPILTKGIRNIGTKRMRNHREMWDELSTMLGDHIYIVSNEDPLANAIISRAEVVLKINTHNPPPFNTTHYSSHLPGDYWISSKKAPDLMALSHFLIHPSLSHPHTYPMVHYTKDMYNIGKKSMDTVYGLIYLRGGEERIDGYIRRCTELVEESDSHEPILINKSAYYHPLVQTDRHIYGDEWMYDPERAGVDTPYGTPLCYHIHAPGIMFRGVDYLEHLMSLMHRIHEGKLTAEYKAYKITEHFYEKDSKGKTKPTIHLFGASIQMPLKIGKLRKRPYSLGWELPDRNSLVRMAKHNPEVYAILMPIDGVSRIVFMIDSEEGIGLFTNWHMSEVLEGV